jgi:hypothetical protein
VAVWKWRFGIDGFELAVSGLQFRVGGWSGSLESQSRQFEVGGFRSGGLELAV